MRVVVVSGPPCGGKSTYVDEHRAPGDVVVDMDRLAYALGYPTPQIDFRVEHAAREVAMVARASILKRLRTVAAHVWVVDTNGTAAGERVVCDPGAEECHRRATADGRPESTHEQIDGWYGTHQTQTRTW